MDYQAALLTHFIELANWRIGDSNKLRFFLHARCAQGQGARRWDGAR
jgi:hypothetical protein